MTYRFSNDPEEVSARMKLIRGKDTKPELQLFSILREAGIPYQAHARVERVQVDALVEPEVAVFVDSPFWHLRDRTELTRLTPYWQERLLKNRRRDQRQTRRLRGAGYSVVRIWSDEVDRDAVVERVRRVRTRREADRQTGDTRA